MLPGNRLLQTQKCDALGRLSEQVLAHEAKQSKQGPPGQTAGGDRLLVRSYPSRLRKESPLRNRDR
ncbi:hypothetical protein JR666_001653 [Salmonella enterica]|nr:hypothetical protein [Salmonella enterica]